MSQDAPPQNQKPQTNDPTPPRKTKNDKRTCEWLPLGVNLLMAVATAAMAFLTYRLASSTSEQVSLYRESFQIESRAYFILKNLSPVRGSGSNIVSLKSLKAGDTIRCSATFVNVGHTPAYDWDNFTETDINTKVRFADRRGIVKKRSGVAVGSNIECPVDAKDRIMTEEWARGLKEGRLFLYFHICETYYDIFGKIHHTFICVRYDFESAAWYFEDEPHNYID